jgi:hypothetical protein
VGFAKLRQKLANVEGGESADFEGFAGLEEVKTDDLEPICLLNDDLMVWAKLVLEEPETVTG